MTKENLKQELLKTGITLAQAEVVATCLLDKDPIICNPEVLTKHPTLLATVNKLAQQLQAEQN